MGECCCFSAAEPREDWEQVKLKSWDFQERLLRSLRVAAPPARKYPVLHQSIKKGHTIVLPMKYSIRYLRTSC